MANVTYRYSDSLPAQLPAIAAAGPRGTVVLMNRAAGVTPDAEAVRLLVQEIDRDEGGPGGPRTP